MAVWKVLEEICIEFRRKSVTVPQNVMDDLKSAKSLINIMQADMPGHIEANQKIAEYLGSVEAYLVSEAPKTFPPQTIENWLTQIEKANHTTCTEETKAEPQFRSRMPRNQKWIRIEPLANLPIDKLEALATESKLSFCKEPDGQLVIYGNAESVKEFIKKATTQTKTTQ